MKVSFGQLYPTTLGFERMFRDLESMLDGSFESSNEKFPPHNIIKLDEARYVVELAVAGFNQDEIDVTVNEVF
jgi:molecular chaperone IbpA